MRIYMFIIMCLLLGYSANVSAITIEKYEGAEAAGGESLVPSGTGEVVGEATATAIAGATETAAAVGRSIARSLFSRQEATGAGNTSETGAAASESTASESNPHVFAGGYVFGPGFASALSAAIAYFLTARFIRIIIYLTYAFSLPKFRQAHLLQAANLAIISFFYLPLIWVSSPKAVVSLASAGIIAELSSRYLVGLYMRMTQKKIYKKGEEGWYVPGVNIEHLMERTGLFVILVIGEVCTSSGRRTHHV